MRKKMLSLALALVMCLSVVPSAFAAEGGVERFSDVTPGIWYWEELEYAVYNGYISGTSATTFSPDANLSRAQLVTILGRMLNVQTSMYTSSKFEDVDMGSWYGPYVAWAAEFGYVNGVDAIHFNPDANITVEQLGTIISNYIRKSGVALKGTVPQEQYADANTISGWAKDNMEMMRQYGLLPVDGKGNVSPRKAATRAEAAVSLVRLAQSAGWGTAPAEKAPTSDYAAEVAAKVESIHNELWATGKITASMTEKEKAIAYFRWMCANCSYDGDWFADPDLDVGDISMESHSAYGPLILGEGVCDGLSLAYKLLLDTECIQSYVKSEIKPGHRYGHAWNVVTLDGKDYRIDLTEGVSFTKWTDGSLDDMMFEENVQKQFYPEEWQAEQDKNSGFTKPTEEELQQMLDSWQ